MIMVYRCSIVCVLLLLLFGSCAAFELDSTYLATINQGMELTFTDQYMQARELFDNLIEADSADYAAYIFLAGVYHAEMLDMEDDTDKDIFIHLVQQAIDLSQEDIKTGDNLAWAHLTCGNAHGYLAAYDGRHGSWWSAVKKGVKAKNQYLKALQVDSTLYDAYLGLGTYHYWKSAKTEFVNWLPFVADRKQQGIDELQLAIDSSLFSREIAANSLLWIHLNQGKPREARRIACDLEQQYPNSHIVLWAQAFTNYHAGSLELASEYFAEIISQIEQAPGNYFNLIECRYQRATIFRRLGRDKNALEELELLLDYPAPDDVVKRQNEKIKNARKMKRELSKP